MSLSAHIEALEKKHAELKEVVHQEMAHPFPDFARVTEWKKQKLRIKEELQRLYDAKQAA